MTKLPNYWWKTKTARISLGVFIAVGVLMLVLFSEQLGQLLNLFGSRAGTVQLLTIDDNPAILDGHGFLGSGDTSDQNIEYVESSGGERGYITMP